MARYDWHWHRSQSDFHRFLGLTVAGRIAASRERPRAAARANHHKRDGAAKHQGFSHAGAATGEAKLAFLGFLAGLPARQIDRTGFR
jgi:hypothetical protein